MLRFWFRWVAANAVGELVGLGTVFAVGYAVFAGGDLPEGRDAQIGIALGMVLLGAFEGFVVGLAQWSALKSRIPWMNGRSWVIATIVGALIAWVFGMIPSTLRHMGGEETPSADAEPSLWFVLLLATAMGLLLGAILAYPQWRVLRQYVRRPWRWIPANMLAWALGMPIIFLGAGSIPDGASTGRLFATILGAITLAGAVVGAVHGTVLMRMVDSRGEWADSR